MARDTMHYSLRHLGRGSLAHVRDMTLTLVDMAVEDSKKGLVGANKVLRVRANINAPETLLL